MNLDAPCKINIGLDLTSRRDDGYHEIATLMYPVAALSDALEALPAAETSLSAVGIPLDCPPDDNLAIRAARLMRERYGAGHVNIRLEKRVPFGAGLGGGSSDAAAAILACNGLFRLGLGTEEMEGAAARLGSDTAFFIRRTPALCTGRGEIIEPYPLRLDGFTAVIAAPHEGVSTRGAYRLVRPRRPSVPLARRLELPPEEWRATIGNAFEEALFPVRPDLAALRNALYEAGAVYASLSGSGSAVYGLFRSVPDIACAQLFPHGGGRVFFCPL